MGKVDKQIIEFLFGKFPQIQEFAADKIQELENNMVGVKGQEKKAELDKQAIVYVSNLIITWDIPQVPNIIENNILDPAIIKIIEIYLPQITQTIYNIGLTGIKKLEDKLS